MRGRWGRLLACAAVATAAGGAAAAHEKRAPQIFAFRPDADTFISAAQPHANFGRARFLRADGSPKATTYLRFGLRKIRGEIASVTLLLHARAGVRAGYQVRRVYRDEWREDRLTYANAPHLSLRYASSKPVRRRSWSAVDVTSFVDEGDRNVSLAITTRSSAGVSFASRETDRGPRLVVRTGQDGSGGPSPGK